MGATFGIFRRRISRGFQRDCLTKKKRHEGGETAIFLSDLHVEDKQLTWNARRQHLLRRWYSEEKCHQSCGRVQRLDTALYTLLVVSLRTSKEV